MSAGLVQGHALTIDRDVLRRLIHARCSCGLQYTAVTDEHEVRSGIVAERHRDHLDAVRS